MATREEFINHVNERLTPLFTKDPEKELWVNERDVQVGAQVVVVNGKRMDQPGQTRHITTYVEVYGDGEIKDVNNETTEQFAQVDFYVIEEGQKHYVCPTICMYYDEHDLFDHMLNELFGL